MAKDDMRMPEGLSPEGRTAYDTILERLKARGLDDGCGCRAFYSPEEWRDRGEEYGNGGVLIVVYDGGLVQHAFSMDRCYDNRDYVPFEEMQAALGAVGMRFEECTRWYAAVYVD